MPFLKIKQHSTQYNTISNTQRQIQNLNISVFDRSNKLDVKKQLKDKFKTFTNWNYREISQRIKKNKKKQEFSRNQTNTDDHLIKVLLSINEKAQSDLKKQQKKTIVQELVGIKQERRQRFKKSENPLHFIKHYIQKQNFKPTEDEMYLIEKTIELKSSIQAYSGFDLQKMLKKVYQLMNLAVDCNELRFLNLLILLTAEVCFQFKDYNRAFYFYNESRIAATYANLINIKTQSLLGMGLIALNLALNDETIIFLKKSLQYAWDFKNIQFQLLIYDYLGQCYYRQGKMKEGVYYHTRYIQGSVQSNDSAIKKISNEMLGDYRRYIKSFENQNLTSLFIEYLNIPISNDMKVPLSSKIKHIYPNYKNGATPRMTRQNKNFDFDYFPDVMQQIQRLIEHDYEFKTQISNPDTHRNFDSLEKFGKKGKTLQFQQSSEFHRIIGKKPQKLNFQNIYKYPLQKRIERALSQKRNPNWWLQMRSNTKKQRMQKVGILKQKIRIAHLSYHKYPDERKRSQSLKMEKIKESLNKTLLDWIDPAK